MGLEELRKKRIEISAHLDQNLLEMQEIAQESKRLETLSGDANKIIDDMDTQFEKLTSLNKTDITFLFFATMLQTLRWYLLPGLKIPKMNELTPSVCKEERLASNERNHIGGIYDGKKSGAEYELDELTKYKEKYKESAVKSQKDFYGKKNKYRSWIEILTQPVPYDALNALDRTVIPNIAGLNKQNVDGTYNNIYGKNHHVATLGHDPILGWLFGTANIMTNTISFVDFQSFNVIQGHKIKSLSKFVSSNELQFSDQAIDYSKPRSMISIFSECIFSTEEDYKRVAAAVVREAIHLTSDKYCVEGLPIPIFATIDPKSTQELIEQGWNSLEIKNLFTIDMKQSGASAGLVLIIDVIIASIYLFCLETKESFDIKKTKIKKILSMSEVVSSSSNLLYVMLTKNMSQFDIGGISITMNTILKSEDFICKMKQEYIRENFEALVMMDVTAEEKY